MTRNDAVSRLDLLFSRLKNAPCIIGILTVDETGAIGLTMDSDDDVDLLRIGVSGRRKAGGITVDVPLTETTPTLEEVR